MMKSHTMEDPALKKQFQNRKLGINKNTSKK